MFRATNPLFCQTRFPVRASGIFIGVILALSDNQSDGAMGAKNSPTAPCPGKCAAINDPTTIKSPLRGAEIQHRVVRKRGGWQPHLWGFIGVVRGIYPRSKRGNIASASPDRFDQGKSYLPVSTDKRNSRYNAVLAMIRSGISGTDARGTSTIL